METNNNSNETMKAMMLSMSEIISDTRSTFPAGCTGRVADNMYVAKSIKDVTNLSYNVEAPDGFIKDGLMVRLALKKKAGEDDKWSGWRAVFELNGIYNGSYSIFCRTELEYKIYLRREMWKVETYKVLYEPLDEDGKAMTRIVKVPMIKDESTGEYYCSDGRCTLNNKVGFAMKKLGDDFNAKIGNTIFDEEEQMFIDMPVIEENK